MTDQPTTQPNVTSPLPVARIKPRRRPSLAWVLPIAALAFAGFLVYRAWSERGLLVRIVFPDGHGLRPGDEVRFRGIRVGEVEDVTLTADADGTLVVASLRTHAGHIARQGTLFWIERPRVGPSGVSGLDTIVGPRYVALHPGDGPARIDFVGLAHPPVAPERESGDLELILEAGSRGSLSRGAPVNYRGVRVGSVLDIGLATDGSAVEARILIEQAYAALIAVNTVFWDSGGVNVDARLTGFSLDVDSLESVIVGSVSLATPDQPGRPVRTGHRFALAPAAEDEWLGWRPNVPIGSDLLPSGAPMPSLERARLVWRAGLLNREVSRAGWTLPIEGGLLGPADVLTADEDARDGSSRLDVAGRSVALAAPSLEEAGLAVLPADAGAAAWPRSSLRRPVAPEDCIAVASPTAPPVPLSAARLTIRDQYWKVDESISFDDSWHGAAVLSRGDGAIVGILLVSEGAARVALMPAAEARDAGD